jgi:hypothetical protein
MSNTLFPKTVLFSKQLRNIQQTQIGRGMCKKYGAKGGNKRQKTDDESHHQSSPPKHNTRTPIPSSSIIF